MDVFSIKTGAGFTLFAEEWALQKHGRNSFLLSLELASMGCPLTDHSCYWWYQ